MDRFDYIFVKKYKFIYKLFTVISLSVHWFSRLKIKYFVKITLLNYFKEIFGRETYELTPILDMCSIAAFLLVSSIPGGASLSSSDHLLSNIVVSVKPGQRHKYLIPLLLFKGFCCKK